jgi:hypothetical protein
MLQASRSIAQAVSRWLPTAAARVPARVWSSGICGEKSGAGAGFPRILRLTLPVFLTPNSPSSQSPGAGTIGQLVAAMLSAPSLDSPPQYSYLILIVQVGSSPVRVLDEVDFFQFT